MTVHFCFAGDGFLVEGLADVHREQVKLGASKIRKRKFGFELWPMIVTTRSAN